VCARGVRRDGSFPTKFQSRREYRDYARKLQGKIEADVFVHARAHASDNIKMQWRYVALTALVT
jgi:hypothetical protein